MKHLLIAVLCIALLTGCSTVDVDTSVSNTVMQGDFILTIESAQSQYSLKKIFDVPLDIKATFTYTGDEAITIWYAALIGLIHLKRGDQEIGEAMAMSLTTDPLKPGESIPIVQDFSLELYQEELTVGEYQAVVYASFYLDKDLTEKVYIEAEVPITIKK